MKHKSKLKFIGFIFPLFPLLIAAGSGNPDSIVSSIPKDSKSVADFIVHNLKTLVEAYNEDEQKYN